jgi:hypothetical protein
MCTYLISSGITKFWYTDHIGHSQQKVDRRNFYVFFEYMPYLSRRNVQDQGYFGLAPVFDPKLLIIAW